MDALTIVLLVGALLLDAFIYLRTRSGCLSLMGPIGLAFIAGGVWNLVVGKEGGWSQIGLGVVGVLIVVGVIAQTYGRRETHGQRESKEGTAKKATSIFISYRRGDTVGYARLQADKLGEHFGGNEVFHDIDSIDPGADFVEALQRAVGSSEVLLAVIGRNWATATDADGLKRLQDPQDYVRMEIVAALQRDIRVIPVLVQGASMPGAHELPNDLAPLAHRNGFELHETSWGSDVQRLIATLERVVQDRRQTEQPT